MRLHEMAVGMVSYLLTGVTRLNGWGNEPGEFKEANPLNTAEVLCGLMWVRHHLPPGALTEKCDHLVGKGVEYLLGTQLGSGGWATGSAYLRTELGSKGNVVSTAWAIWALVERKRAYIVDSRESEGIYRTLQRSHGFLLHRLDGLWPYNPDLENVDLMASTYGLFGLAWLMRAERYFGEWANRRDLRLCFFEGLNRFECDYITEAGILEPEPPMNRMVVIQLYLALTFFLGCDALSVIDNKLRVLQSRLWGVIRGYSPEQLVECIVERQAVVEPGRARDFIHYTPVWGIIAAMNSPDGIQFRHFRILLNRILQNVDSRCDGASYGGSKRHTWTTALTLMALSAIIDNMDFSAFVLPRYGGQYVEIVDPGRVFVVHGRNDKARRAMFDFLRSLGLSPVEWGEAIRLTGAGLPYVGEGLDKAFEQAQAIVIVMSGDDEARLRSQFRHDRDPEYEKSLTPQVRPNVIFEAGMALGRNPDRTIIVQDCAQAPFSDIGGRHVLHFAGTAEDRQALATRLETAGCPVQRVGQDWLSSGDFAGALMLHHKSGKS